MTYRLSACIDGLDLEGEGETWDEMLRAYTADCRKNAAESKATSDALLREAERCERFADQGGTHGS